jgi:tRNA (guanine37-N1)-methyltransferase
MRFHVISLFPAMVEAYVTDSILGRAIADKKLSVKYYNPRDFTKDKHARVDKRPYGGGPGMVLEAEPFLRAAKKAKGKKVKRVKTVFFTPKGKLFTNTLAREWAKKYDDIIFLSGRYEGIDERAPKILRAEAISVGPYVLTGGEIPTMIVIDAVSRQMPGILGSFDSVEEERTASHEVYTRPEVLVWNSKKYRVPKVLLSGNHKVIDAWRLSRGNGGVE